MSIPINMALVQNYSDDSRLKFSAVVTTFLGVATQLHLSILSVERYLVTHGSIKRGNILVAYACTHFKSNKSRRQRRTCIISNPC
jgi:hypothetical protein